MAADIKIRQKIFVSKENDSTQYVSEIQDVNEDEISIALPLHKATALIARVGYRLSVRLPRDSYCLEFTTPVIDIRKDNVPLYVLRYPEETTRIQQRSYVRLDILMDAMYAVPVPGEEKPLYKKATALNISAGGIKLSVLEKVEERSPILIKFEIKVKGSAYEFEIKSVVMRSAYVYGTRSKSIYHLGVLFQEISNAQRDLIYQFIFARMADLRRRDRG